MTFSDYLTNIRLHHAVEDLIYTDMPVTKIVYDNGFSSQTFFSRKFKSIYDETPANFRKHFRNESDQLYYEKLLPEKDQKLQAFLEKRLSSHVGDGSEQEKSESEVFEVGQWSLEEKTLFQTINVGMAEYLLRSEVREQLKDLKKMLGIKYIRFCNLFTPELMVNMTEDVEKINFSKINQIFDYLHSEGFRVHLEIGMKQQRQMHHLTALNDKYYFTKEDAVLKEELQNYFADGKHMKKVIELKGLKNGEYLLKLYRINRHNGSVLDIWREMAFEEELSKEDVRYLKEASHPKMTMERIYVKTQDFRINVMMDINEVIYIQMLYLL